MLRFTSSLSSLLFVVVYFITNTAVFAEDDAHQAVTQIAETQPSSFDTSASPTIQLQEDETTWVEEKITPSTRWIESVVSPWTQWMERKIQRQTLHTVNRPNSQTSPPSESEEIEIETSTTETSAETTTPAMPMISLNEAISRVESLYDGNILGANFIDQVPPLYRIKVLLPNGEIRIVQINAETGKLW